MASAAKIVIEIKANKKDLDDKVEKSKRSVRQLARTATKFIAKGFAKGARKAIKAIGRLTKKIFSLKGAIVSLAAAAGAGFLVSMIKGVADTARELDVWSKTLNVSVNTLQQWQFALKEAGFDAEKVTDIFKDTSEKLGDFFGAGGGEAADLFNEFGISAKEFVAIGPDKALIKLAKATKQLSTQKRILIFDSLANDASKLIPVLDNIEESFKEFTALGLESTKSQIRNAKNIGKQFSTIGTIITSLKNQIISELAPAFDPLFKKIKKFIIDAGGVRKVAISVAKGIVDIAIGAVKGFSSLVNDVKGVFGSLEEQITRVQLGAAKFITFIAASKATFGGLTISRNDPAAMRAAKEQVALEVRLGKIIKQNNTERFTGTDKAVEVMEKFRDAIGESAELATEVRQEFDTTFKEVETKQDKKKKKTDEWKEKLKKANKELTMTKDLLQKIEEAQEKLQTSAEFGTSVTALSDLAARASSFDEGAAAKTQQQKLFDQARLQFTQFDPNKERDPIKLDITITADENGIISPVVKSEQMEAEVTNIVVKTINLQAKVNDR